MLTGYSSRQIPALLESGDVLSLPGPKPDENIMMDEATLPSVEAPPLVSTPPPIIESDPVAVLEQLAPRIRVLKAEIAKVIIGQEDIIIAALYALFSRGHCLLVGVPGLAKTLLVHTLARSLELSFSRIQFTPDLMPSDITGTEILEEDTATGHRRFVFTP
jgi:ATPase family associated with various cellular activities (AAA)